MNEPLFDVLYEDNNEMKRVELGTKPWRRERALRLAKAIKPILGDRTVAIQDTETLEITEVTR